MTDLSPKKEIAQWCENVEIAIKSIGDENADAWSGGIDCIKDDENLTDVLADLMHWADLKAIPFHGCLAIAERHHDEEVLEAKEPTPDTL